MDTSASIFVLVHNFNPKAIEYIVVGRTINNKQKTIVLMELRSVATNFILANDHLTQTMVSFIFDNF